MRLAMITEAIASDPFLFIAVLTYETLTFPAAELSGFEQGGPWSGRAAQDGREGRGGLGMMGWFLSAAGASRIDPPSVLIAVGRRGFGFDE